MLKDKKKIIKYTLVGAGALAIHWILMAFAYYLMMKTAPSGEANGFFSFFYTKLSGSGDVPHYVNIANNWYTAVGENANEIVFFPLFPVLMKIFGVIFGDLVLAGVVVSNICLVVASVFLYRLIEEEYDSERALDGYLLFQLFPVGFFMIGCYTESLFVMLVVMALFYMRKKKWLAVGIIGMFAALSRSQGIVLFAPVVYEACFEFKNKEKGKYKTLFSLLIPLGTLMYFILNQVIYGKWNIFLDFQAKAPWYNTSHWVSENLATQYNMALENVSLAAIIYWPQILLFFLSIVVLFYGIKKKVRTSYIVLGGSYIFVTYLHGWMISGPRYVMSCIPLYIILAAAHKNLRRILIPFFAMLSLLFAMLSLRGFAIM